MDKGTDIFSDLGSFFSKNGSDRALNCILGVMRRINIRPGQIGVEKRANCKFTARQVLNLLMVFTLFSVGNASRYPDSPLGKLFHCGKDMFYRFMNDGNVRWRELLYAVSMRLLRRIRRGSESPAGPVCLIADDTDLPKTGMRAELLGKVFSHLMHKCILGHKCLTLMWSDGRSQLMLDFSLHGEEGKVKGKSQGLTAEQRAARRTKDHGGQAVERRVAEYMSKKTDMLAEMVKRAIKRGVRFDYLLVDSWFTTKGLVRFIKNRRAKCHLLGMLKMGANTKYGTKWGEMSAAEIVRALKRGGGHRHNKALNCKCCATEATLDGVPVKLLFFRRGRRGEWKGLLTTDLELGFAQAYRLYARRWTIEVAYKDCKTLLGLGDCQSLHFSAQIASVSLTLMQYNILCTVKRFEAYETIGGLFADATGDTLELSVADRIWETALMVIKDAADLFDADAEKLIQLIVGGNPFIHRLKSICDYANAHAS